MGKANMLDVDNIRIDGGTQARSELNESVVAQYADAISAGEKLPPVVTFFDGTDHWLADGFHRLFAHKKLEIIEIDAEIHRGTRRDAVLYSVGANRKHGLPPSNADKRKAVELLLNDAEWSKWSQQKIASTCGVSAGFVSKLVGELASIHGEEIKPKVRTVERAGKTYEQNTAKIGKAAPVEAAPAPKQPKKEAEEVDYCGPSDDELDDAMKAAEADMSSLEALMAADDKLAAAVAEIKRLKMQLAAVESARDGYMNRSNELISRINSLKKKIAKMEAVSV
jgi:hypothetical protein